jgi:hypothetical protein
MAFMALLLPGEKDRRPGLVEALLAIGAVVALSSLGCATPTRTRRLAPSIFQGAHAEPKAPRRSPRRPAPNEGSALVEHALHDAGLRFGTDGSARALWGYLRTSHETIAAADARPGDVVFFDTRGTGEKAECANTDHAGLVESAEIDGRIGFVESRGGQLRHSFVQPDQPTVRRGDRGQIMNTFLRAKRVDDPPTARYFAGEMLCGVYRVRR